MGIKIAEKMPECPKIILAPSHLHSFIVGNEKVIVSTLSASSCRNDSSAWWMLAIICCRRASVRRSWCFLRLRYYDVDDSGQVTLHPLKTIQNIKKLLKIVVDHCSASINSAAKNESHPIFLQCLLLATVCSTSSISFFRIVS